MPLPGLPSSENLPFPKIFIFYSLLSDLSQKVFGLEVFATKGAGMVQFRGYFLI